MLSAEFVVLHDLHVPDSRANVDHLVIGPNGVFIVDSKPHTGKVTEGDGTLCRGKFPIRKDVETQSFISELIAAHLEVPVALIPCCSEAELPRPGSSCQREGIAWVDAEPPQPARSGDRRTDCSIKYKGLGAAVSCERIVGAKMRESDLVSSDLQSADLSGADLMQAQLWGANLAGAHLARACLVLARLRSADLSGEYLGGTNLNAADL